MEGLFDTLGNPDLGNQLISQTTQDIVDLNNQAVTMAKSGDLEGAVQLFIQAVNDMPANQANDFHRARYVDRDGKLLAEQPDCLRYDASVDGRFDLYKRSMHELLNPKERGTKRTLTNADLIIDVGIRPLDGKTEKPLGGFGQVRIPEGASAGFLNGLQHKQLIADLYLAKRDPARLDAAGKKAQVATLQAIADEVLKHPARFVDILREQRDFLSANYETCTQEIENEGHRFGEDLSEADKKALTAFLATL